MEVIARIKTDFPTKFGVPRQSGLVPTLRGTIVFEPKYRNDEALRGIEEFSHLWLIWQFSENIRDTWSPTVRPPRLGGNNRLGVFATRSSFRPNNLGLSSVKLLEVKKTQDLGTVLIVGGADLINNTPIFDIKPYLTTTDCHPDAKDGFVTSHPQKLLDVTIPQELSSSFPKNKIQTLIEVLQQDPRPAYQHDNTREYGFIFDENEIHFTVDENHLLVTKIKKL